MKTFGLIGYPLTQSFSQKYFTKKFEQEGIDAQYINFSIESIDLFNENVISAPGLIGLNVTIPYKEKVIPFLNELDITAAKVGAVNVAKVSSVNNQLFLKGFNSDVVGFEKSLKPLLKPYHKNALIIGTGGASKAVKYVLDLLGIEGKFVSRNPVESNFLSYQDLTPKIIKAHTLIINTTPLGMFPKIDDFPDIPYQAIGNDHLCYDLIYNPEETLFLQKSKMNGATVKNGLEMLILQAERSWEIWNE
jgi:shikimate dehydrogenase